jgi:hypothetical protein
MRSFFVTVAVAMVVLAGSACQNKRRPEPVPPPQSKHAVAAHADSAHAVSEISWFQGTLDEAFSGGPCPRQRRPLLHF